MRRPPIASLRPGLVLGARDFRADPSVYAAFYLPWVGRLSMSARLSWMGRLTGAPFNDAVFFLTVPPREAIRRIDARIAAEEADPARIVETRSWRWRHLHEDPETLAALQRAYYRAFRILQRRWPVHVYEIDTETLSQAQVVEFIVATIRDCLRDRSGIPASPRWVRHSAAGTSVMPT